MATYMRIALLIATFSGYSYSYTEQQLSIQKAINIVMKMNYNDTSDLYKIVFEEPNQDQSTIYAISSKIYSGFETLAEKLIGKSQKKLILEILTSASIEDRKRILDAIQTSYNEYKVEYGIADTLIFLLTFPFGFLHTYKKHTEHIKQVEANRLALRV